VAADPPVDDSVTSPMWVAALLLAADLVTLDASLGAEGRTGAAANDPNSATRSVQLDGYAGMVAKFSDLTVSAGYSPRMVETPPPQGSGLAVYHSARLGLDYRPSATSHLILQQLGSIGRNDFSPLAAPGALRSTTSVPIDPRLPVKALLAMGSSDTSLSWDQNLSRRVSVNGSAGYSVYGGADGVAQQYIPLEHGLRAGAGVAWQVAPSDRLSLTASASRTTFNTGAKSVLGSVNGGWSTELGRSTRADLGIGSSFGRTTGSSAGSSPTPFPSVSAGISHTFAMRGSSVSTSLRAAASPQVDRTTGSIYEVATGSAGVGWAYDRNLSLSAGGSFGRALSGNQQVGTQLVTAEGSGQYRFERHLNFSLGVRSAWQSVPNGVPGTLTAPGFQWALFGHLTFVLHGTL